VNQADFVLATVVLVNFAPVSMKVTRQVVERSITRCLEGSESTGCSENLPRLELFLQPQPTD